MFGRTTRRKMVELRGAERPGRLLHVLVELVQDGLHGSNDERERHEEQREHDRRASERDVDADRRSGAVQRQEHEARDDGGQRERQVDHRVDEALAAKVVSDEDPRDQGADDAVDQGDHE